MSNLVPFNFENKFEINTVIKDEIVHFHARAIASALNYIDQAQAYRTHCKSLILFSSVELTELNFPNPNPRGEYFILEPDVYRLIIKSNKPEAERFEKWVFEEVLPSIRKTGKYAVNQNLDSQLFKLMDERFERLEKVLIPKAITYDLLIKQDNHLSMEEAAKLLNQDLSLDGTRYKLSNQILLQFLRDYKYISKRNIAYTKYIDLGYFAYKLSVRYNQYTGQMDDVFSSTLITPKGLNWIISPLKNAGLLPVAFNKDYLHPVTMMPYEGVEVHKIH